MFKTILPFAKSSADCRAQKKTGSSSGVGTEKSLAKSTQSGMIKSDSSQRDYVTDNLGVKKGIHDKEDKILFLLPLYALPQSIILMK